MNAPQTQCAAGRLKLFQGLFWVCSGSVCVQEVLSSVRWVGLFIVSRMFGQKVAQWTEKQDKDHFVADPVCFGIFLLTTVCVFDAQ